MERGLGILECQQTFLDIASCSAMATSLKFTLLPSSDVLLTDELADTLSTSAAGTDLRIDWEDAASLGYDGEQYFLVIVDKGSEHVVTYNTKTRSDPVDLLDDYITITKRVPKFLRVDGAKEMKSFCHLHHITLQVVTRYSHTMQARVEGVIGIIKQHSRIALSTANVPTRFWPYATTDFVYKHNFLWCSPDRNGLLSTPQARLQSVFAGTMSTVAHPFGSRIIARLPKLHSHVIGKSFGHRYAEGIYLCSDDKTPAVHMYDMMSRKIMIVSDFIVYPDQFPFHSLNCLVHPSYTAAEIAKIHTQDIADDAAVSADQQTPDPTIFTRPIQQTSLDEVVSVLPVSLTIAPQEIPVKRIPTNTPGGLPPLDSKLAELTEYDIARTMARHNFTFALPPDYSPPTLPAPLGEMIVTVKSAVKLGKKSDAKSTVWVQFLAPPTHAGFKMQLYPRSHESSRSVGQGHDFSILSTLARTSPRATTFLDLGITEFTSAKVTAAMLLAFTAMNRSPVLLLPFSMMWKLSLVITVQHDHQTHPRYFLLSMMMMMTLPYQKGIHGILRTLLIAVRLCDNGFAVTGSPLRIWKWPVLSNERSGIACYDLLSCLRIRSFRLVFITRLNEKAANLKNVKSA